MKDYTVLTMLIEQARNEGKWLHCAYQDLWFSPNELEKENANGRFRWRPENWEVCNPCVEVAQLQKEVSNAQDALVSFEKRVANVRH